MRRNFLFDLDQTLLDFHASEHIALEKLLNRSGLKFDESVYDRFRAYNKKLWQELENGNISRKELFILRFNYLFEICEGDSSDLDPMALNDEFIKIMSLNGVILDGAADFLKALKEDIKDSRIYIITNGAVVNAEGRIKSTGIDKYIDGLFVGESMGVNKPSKEYFDIVLNEISAGRDSCIVIGDSLSSDMKGASNASLTSVWFMPKGDVSSLVKDYDINYTAASYDELYRILKAWSE